MPANSNGTRWLLRPAELVVDCHRFDLRIDKTNEQEYYSVMEYTSVGIDKDTKKTIKVIIGFTGEMQQDFIRRLVMDEFSKMNIEKMASSLKKEMETSQKK